MCAIHFFSRAIILDSNYIQLTWRERYVDGEIYAAFLKTEHDSTKAGPMISGDSLLEHNMFWLLPNHFLANKDLTSIMENFQNTLADKLVGHVSNFTNRMATSEEVSTIENYLSYMLPHAYLTFLHQCVRAVSASHSIPNYAQSSTSPPSIHTPRVKGTRSGLPPPPSLHAPGWVPITVTPRPSGSGSESGFRISTGTRKAASSEGRSKRKGKMKVTVTDETESGDWDE